MQGASAIQATMEDGRAAQYWDPDRLVSREIQEAVTADPNHPFARCCSQSRFVWDVVAVFPRGVRWDNQFPAPIFAGRTVVEVAQGFRDALAALATQSGTGRD